MKVTVRRARVTVAGVATASVDIETTVGATSVTRTTPWASTGAATHS